MGLIPGSEDPLEEGMATDSSTLAWRIPWTEEPGGLQSMVSGKSHTTEHTHGGCDVSRWWLGKHVPGGAGAEEGSKDTSCLCPSGHMLSFYRRTSSCERACGR